MKKLKKLKLNQLSKAEIEKRELNHLKGGVWCDCMYEGEQCSQNDSYYGGSTISANYSANN